MESELPPVSSPSTPPPGEHPRARILVVDDHENMVASLALNLRRAGYEVTEARGGAMALEKLADGPFDVVLTDLRMDGVDGMAVLRRALELSPPTQVILMTAFGSFDGAVEAIQAGAYWYISKPFTDDQLLLKIARAVEKSRLLSEVRLLSDEFRERNRLENIVGRSAEIRELLARVVKVAPTDASVLITGEGGTGKESIARAIHANSRRADRPFVAINCAGIPETLLESELFGHARGAFAGSDQARRGLLEEASGGTFFLNDIGVATPTFQARLLRLMEEGSVRRVGENTPVRVDVRIIAANPTDLKADVAARRFREDLYFRLNVVPLRVPPLRDRRVDIPLLADHFLQRFDERNATKHRFGAEALERLCHYAFPGNVRELQNVVEQAAALSAGEVIQAPEVPLDLSAPETVREPAVATSGRDESLAEIVDRAEKTAVEQAIARSPGDLHAVAQRLHISSTTLWRKMKRFGIVG